MLICPVCGKVNPATSHNCDVCGAPLNTAMPAPVSMAPVEAGRDGSGPICPKCRRVNRSASVFCAFCGYRLRQSDGGQPYVLPYAGSLPRAAVPATSPRVASEVSGNLPAGTVLKRRYRILRKVAQGGMGAVYESTDLMIPGDARWAVKEISPVGLPPSERTQAIADFRREAQMLATLQHPNLPQVVETFEEMEKHFLVMEFIPGHTLQNIIESTPGFLPEERVMVWARQLFDVLHYLHFQNPPIVYRDLKPANIMLLESTERIKLIDFGIARFHKAGKSRDTEAFGTAGYAPPEQYGKGQTDQRSDVYALAATLHYLVSKHDPTLNPFNWLPVRQYNPGASQKMDWALQRALNLDPLKRFQSIDDFAEALGVLLSDTPRIQYAPEVYPAAPLPPVQQPVAAVAPAVETALQRTPARKKSSQPPRKEAVAPTPAFAPAIAGMDSSTATPAATLPPVAPVDIHVPTLTGAMPDQGATSTEEVATKTHKSEPAPSLAISEPVLDLGDAKWNNRPARKVAIRNAGGANMKGIVMSSQPWIAYNPQHFQGNAITLEVKVKKRQLRFGRVELHVPNLFYIIWSRTRGVLPLIGCWFWLLLLVASSLGKTLLWGALATMGALVLSEAVMWLWALHVRWLVPEEKLNTGRLLVRSSGGEQHIEVRVMARPAWARKALGWTMALLLLVTELAAVTWAGLALVGIEVPLPGL